MAESVRYGSSGEKDKCEVNFFNQKHNKQSQQLKTIYKTKEINMMLQSHVQ